MHLHVFLPTCVHAHSTCADVQAGVCPMALILHTCACVHVTCLHVPPYIRRVYHSLSSVIHVTGPMSGRPTSPRRCRSWVPRTALHSCT